MNLNKLKSFIVLGSPSKKKSPKLGVIFFVDNFYENLVIEFKI